MRTPLRKLLKHRPRKPRVGECTCDHPRVRHVKPPHVRRYYQCNVKGCECYIAANLWAHPKGQGRSLRLRGMR